MTSIQSQQIPRCHLIQETYTIQLQGMKNSCLMNNILFCKLLLLYKRYALHVHELFQKLQLLLTLRPNIWLIAADSFNVHSDTTLPRISFMKSMKAFKGFFT